MGPAQPTRATGIWCISWIQVLTVSIRARNPSCRQLHTTTLLASSKAGGFHPYRRWLRRVFASLLASFVGKYPLQVQELNFIFISRSRRSSILESHARGSSRQAGRSAAMPLLAWKGMSGRRNWTKLVPRTRDCTDVLGLHADSMATGTSRSLANAGR